MKRGMGFRIAARAVVVLSAMGALAACNADDAAADAAPAQQPVSIGGSVTGLAGGPLLLRLNAAETLTVPANGAFTFATQQAPGASWSVALTRTPLAQNCAVANGSGVAQGQPVTNVAVTCAMRTWRATESPGAAASEHQFRPLVAIDGQGTAILLLNPVTTSQSYGGRLQAAERSAAGVWTAVGTTYIDNSAGGNGHFVYGHDLAAAGNGQAFAIWGEIQPSDSHYVMVSRRTGVGQWSVPVRLDSNQVPGMYVTPQVAVSADQSAIAVWAAYDLQEAGQSVYASRYQPGTGWGAAVRLDSVLSPVQAMRVAMDAQGNAVVIWVRGGGGPDDEIWATSFRSGTGSGTGWASPVQLDNGSQGRGQQPRIAMNDGGAAIATWTRFNTDTQRSSAMAAQFTLAGGWAATPVQLVPETEQWLLDTRLAMNASGHAFVAMELYSTQTSVSSAQVRRFTPGGGWEPAVELATGVTQARVGVDPDGNATLVYAPGNLTASLLSRRYLAANPGAGWLPADENVDGMDAGASQEPELAVGADGRAMVVFSQLTATNPSVRTAHAVRLD